MLLSELFSLELLPAEPQSQHRAWEIVLRACLKQSTVKYQVSGVLEFS